MATASKKWSDMEIAQLKQLAGKMSAAEIGAQIGRSKEAVRKQINNHKLASYKPYDPPPIITGDNHKATVALRKPVAKPALRQKPPSREWSALEWCPKCGAPVSNWTEHHARMPECRKRA